MIYRKWSLLTGPVTILGGIVGAIVVSTYAFVDSASFVKQEQKKSDASSTK